MRLFLLLILLMPGLAANARPVTVFAAASLQGVLDSIAKDLGSADQPGFRVSYGATSTQARQIEQGAPADLFISADQTWMDHLEDAGRIVAGSRVDLLGNSLVVIAPTASLRQRLRIDLAEDWLAAVGDGRLALAEVSRVPAGRAARAALQSLRVWDAVMPRVAQAEDVRAALAFVAQSEAPIGIVYATDARVETRVRVVAEIPASLHPPIRYPMALIVDQPAARRVYQHLLGAVARQRFDAAGFLRPEARAP